MFCIFSLFLSFSCGYFLFLLFFVAISVIRVDEILVWWRLVSRSYSHCSPLRRGHLMWVFRRSGLGVHLSRFAVSLRILIWLDSWFTIAQSVEHRCDILVCSVVCYSGNKQVQGKFFHVEMNLEPATHGLGHPFLFLILCWVGGEIIHFIHHPFFIALRRTGGTSSHADPDPLGIPP